MSFASRVVTLGLLILVTGVSGCASDGGSDARPPAVPSSTNLKPPAGTDAYVSAVKNLKAGNDDAAVADLEAALTVNPGLQMARMTLGELYMKRQSYEKAVPQFQAATEMDPYTLKNFYNLGLSLQVINRLQESGKAYARAIDLDPNDFKSNMNLGLVYFALGQMDPAIRYIEKATRVEPGNVKAWSNLGVAYDAAGNAVLAEASYRKALELDSTNEATLINLTSNLIGQKKTDDAIATAERLVAVTATPLSRKRLGDAQTLAKRYDDAIGSYDAALALDPKYAPAMNAKAEALVGKYEANLRLDDSLRQRALAAWKQSLALEPNQPAVKQNVAAYEDPKQFK